MPHAAYYFYFSENQGIIRSPLFLTENRIGRNPLLPEWTRNKNKG